MSKLHREFEGTYNKIILKYFSLSPDTKVCSNLPLAVLFCLLVMLRQLRLTSYFGFTNIVYYNL